VPVLDDALGVLECRLENQVEAGDHTLFIGRVLHAQVNPEYYSQGWDANKEDGVLMVVQRDRYTTFFENI
jgi:flavin reductase (DIM6/NTAB) family NADH-FMN oxidoreductase RutF